jgi:subtilisin family serine protease
MLYFSVLLFFFCLNFERSFGCENPPTPLFVSGSCLNNGRYIIQLKGSAAEYLAHLAEVKPLIEQDADSSIFHEFQEFCSYSAVLSDKLKHALLQRTDIMYMESVSRICLCGMNRNQPVTGNKNTFASPIIFQPNSPWGLARVSSVGKYQPNDIFRYPASSGRGVDVYVLDSGIYVNHNGFGGRAVFGANFIPNEPASDIAGHGTFIAGLIGGSVFGMAKAVNLISVKILDGNGDGYADILIAGIHWAVSQASKTKRPSIINLSLTTARSKAINDAVEKAYATGILVVVAAGNKSNDACIFSPASSSSAITVSSSDAFDFFSPFSNWGPCVDIFAPGTSVSSSFIGSPNAFATDSGTSQAAALVSGTAALILAENPGYSPAEVRKILMEISAKNSLTALPYGTPNLLLDTSLLLSSD